MILGISGVAGSGKDTFAKFLGPHGACNVALADPLKKIARDIYDFTDEQLWGPSAERNKPDKRYPREHSWDGLTCACCGASRSTSVGEELPPCFLTPRYALQLLGTQWGRECYPDTWAVKCVRTAKELLGSALARYDAKSGLYHLSGVPDAERVKLVTISDVRFKNEMRVIREAGGKILRVRRPGAGLQGSSGLHASEAEQASIPDDEFDLVIENDGTLEALQEKASALVRALA